MARSFGKFTTTIYDSDEFRALTFEQQGVYYMLGLQGEISAAGVLPLRLKRWTRNATDATVDGLLTALATLADLGHVVYDEDTEELLIVKFVKWDKGYANEKRRPVVGEAARDVTSPALRSTLAAELRNIASDMASDTTSDRASDAISAYLSALASDIDPDTTSRIDRLVVTKGEYVTPLPNPQSTSREPPPSSDDAEPSPFCSKHPEGTEDNCRDCATARRRHDQWIKNKPSREAAKRQRAETLALIAANCDRCEGTHFILDADKKPTRRKCNHHATQ